MLSKFYCCWHCKITTIFSITYKLICITFHCSNNIDKNSHLTPKELAVRLGQTEEVIRKEIQAMEAERIICGYPTLIMFYLDLMQVSMHFRSEAYKDLHQKTHIIQWFPDK